MALQISAVVTAIAGLSVSGVTIADDSAIPPDAQNTRSQYLFPEPSGFVTDFSIQIDSFGEHAVAKMTAFYTLNYTYCHVPVGAGRTGLDAYSGLVEKVGLILDAIIANSITAAIDVHFPTVTVAPFEDAAGGFYLGAHITIACKEFVN